VWITFSPISDQVEAKFNISSTWVPPPRVPVSCVSRVSRVSYVCRVCRVSHRCRL
jgi:hypothetical protein